MQPNPSIAELCLIEAIATFRSQVLAEGAINQLEDSQLHQALDPNTNSIAVIMKHMAGNMRSRWTDFLTSDGEKPWRNRDDEFIDDFTSALQLRDYWEQGWECLLAALSALRPDDLEKTIRIRGEPHNVIKAIDRQLAHYGYHVGQIVMIARILAKDQWTTLTIPRGQSAQYNKKEWKEGEQESGKQPPRSIAPGR